MAIEPTRTEIIPSVRGNVSGIASANAPIIFIDEYPNSGYYNGIAHITCETIRFMVVDGVTTTDRVIVAHLRMNLSALAALKQAIANVELMISSVGPEHTPPAHQPPPIRK